MNNFILRLRISETKKIHTDRETGVGIETERISGEIPFGFRLILKNYFLRCINVRIFTVSVFICGKERTNTVFARVICALFFLFCPLKNRGA